MASFVATATKDVVLVPMKVDCFVFNEAVFTPKDETSAKIAPLTQPNYTLLRYDQKYLSSDILRHTDLHATGSAQSNSRFTDLGTGEPIKNRQGIYVHWMLPRPYRGGVASTKESGPNGQPGSSPSLDAGKDETAKLNVPSVRAVPPRWLVIRHIDLPTVDPQNAVTSGLVPEIKAFVIESDHRQTIDKLDDSVDLQVDVSPYITASDSNRTVERGERVDNISIEEQAEVFIGSKWDAETWLETTRDRVTLDLAQASNQLLADFQPHNSNVFSMIDNLTYKDGSVVKQINHASVSYHVIGWHWNADDDLFTIKADPGKRIDRGARLDQLNMALNDSQSDDVKAWRNMIKSTRVLCHGTNYEVIWDVARKPEVPADDFCSKLMKDKSISIGTTALNSVITYIHAHVANAGGAVQKLMQDVLKLEVQLIARDEGVEAEQRALNIARGANFKRFDGGKYLYFADTNEKATGDHNGKRSATSHVIPTADDLKSLLSMNQRHFYEDNLARLAEKLSWDMFSMWWSFLTDLGATKTRSDVIVERNKLRKRLIEVNNTLNMLKAKNEEDYKASKNLQAGVMEPFYQVSDPTLMIAGVESGWPHDYLDPLKVRLEYQTLGNGGLSQVSDAWGQFTHVLQRCIPPDMLEASECLVEEFALLRTNKNPNIEDKKRFMPLYHDNVIKPDGTKIENQWRDSWNGTQPFFPLFVEWEIEYTHIAYKYWSLQDITPDPSSQASRTKYVVDKKAFDEDSKSDGKNKPTEGTRLCTGRSLLLPQPSFSLEAKIQALFSQMPEPQLDEKIPKADRDTMIPKLRQLPFLSAQLTGFVDHLLTRLHGAHVKPNNRGPDGVAVPIAAAIKAAKDAAFEKVDLRLIGNTSDLTPYGSLIQFEDHDNSAFKPVTHGQFRFTKLNIIDKFGQAIHAIDPWISELPKSKVPLTSGYYAPQRLLQAPVPKGTVASTDPADYEYIQVPPQINQPARLNASFVQLVEVEKGKKPLWKPTTEWENPVWGWVVINYANYGLQFFLADGTFYREVRIGGPTGTQGSAEWLPFAPSDIPAADSATQQLQMLIKQLSSSAVYLEAFVGMIDACMPTLLAAPPGYSQNRSAVVGRPLALVNTGWSLELSTERYQTQVLGGKTVMPKILADEDSFNRDPSDTRMYSFEIKLGSREKNYDALVGYFKAKSLDQNSDNDPEIGARIGDALNLNELYTYYSKTKSPPIKSIEGNFPRFFPFYYDPTKRDPDTLWRLRCREQQVFGVLMDPFSALHAYSSILPTKELQLPPWVIQTAFAKMTTFFTIGPVFIPKDIPPVNDSNQVPVTEIARGRAPDELKLGLPMAVTTLGEWNWLQPYRETNQAGSEQMTYKRLKLEKSDQRARFEETPYTAVEGYLQLVQAVGAAVKVEGDEDEEDVDEEISRR